MNEGDGFLIVMLFFIFVILFNGWLNIFGHNRWFKEFDGKTYIKVGIETYREVGDFRSFPRPRSIN